MILWKNKSNYGTSPLRTPPEASYFPGNWVPQSGSAVLPGSAPAPLLSLAHCTRPWAGAASPLLTLRARAGLRASAGCLPAQTRLKALEGRGASVLFIKILST